METETRYECPECGLPFDADGTEGLVPHLFEWHIGSTAVLQLMEWLYNATTTEG